ncbi:hypothetical protein LCGC14_0446870 [marine sediment metagenome]|uniref:Ornithine cyclodeaminase n=1 Tax=marine sediment metagenome TaxID=412755 RepID=A0A0F9V5V3_9ZZZZ
MNVKWVSMAPGTPEYVNLRDAHWMVKQMELLLALQRTGEARLGEEGYLSHPETTGGFGFSRAITMSAWVGHPDEPEGVFGAKWVSSHPPNTSRGLPRGQAITILNCAHTGLPLLVFDGTDLSNARTAGFAIMTILEFCRGVPPPAIALIGAGRVHEWQAHYINQLWPNTQLFVYDPDKERAQRFVEQCQQANCFDTWQEVVDVANIVSLATAGAGQWVPTDVKFDAFLWINTSLRDVTPGFFNRFKWIVVDDLEFAASQHTPYHDAWQAQTTLTPNVTQFSDVNPKLQYKYPIIVNPMGLALWDVGLGYALFQQEFREQREALLHGHGL